MSLEDIFTRQFMYRKVNVVDLVRCVWDLQTEVNVYSQQHSLAADVFSCVSEEGDICKGV